MPGVFTLPSTRASIGAIATTATVTFGSRRYFRSFCATASLAALVVSPPIDTFPASGTAIVPPCKTRSGCVGVSVGSPNTVSATSSPWRMR